MIALCTSAEPRWCRCAEYLALEDIRAGLVPQDSPFVVNDFMGGGFGKPRLRAWRARKHMPRSALERGRTCMAWLGQKSSPSPPPITSLWSNLL